MIAFAIAAHPDDIEFLMAGTMLRLQHAGYELHYMNVANGCCGTTQYERDEIAAIRAREGREAAESIGAVFHPSICNDLEVFYELSLLRKLASVIREVQPTIVLTHALSDYMEDHMNTARLAVTAAFSRGMPNFPVDPPRPHYLEPVTVYHAQPYTHHDPLGRLVLPQSYVDTADLLSQKTEMLSKHLSQKLWLDESQGHDSYLETLRSLDRELGRHSGVFKAAEGWTRHLPVGFCGADDDPLRDALGPHLHRAEDG
ncbi:MAG: PIG-L family deacetylase [Planctomycetales bacterium]|nr:PIG-L family deacetylase [Planctomycetales bacterium]